MAAIALINPPNCHLCGSRVFKIRLDGRLVWRVRHGKITPPEIDIILPRVSVHDLVCFNCGNDFIHATTAPYRLPPPTHGGDNPYAIRIT